MDPDHLCRAATRQGGNCNQPSGFGTDHLGVGRCKFHGGSTPDHQLAGVVELARRDGTLNAVPIEIEPHDAILQCIYITAGWVRYASDKVAALQPEALIGGVTSTKTRPLKLEQGAESSKDTVQEQTVEPGALHAWLRVQGEWMDRLEKYSTNAIRNGIAERHVRIAEQQGTLMAAAIRNILASLGVADHPDAPKVVRRELEVIAGGRA